MSLCDPCARVSRVCPGSPTAPPGVFLPVRYLYPFHTDTMYRYRLPPVSFYRYR